MNKFVATAIALCLGTAALGAHAQQGKKFDPYTEGAKSGKFDPYSEGANKSSRAELTDASAPEATKKSSTKKKSSSHKKSKKKAAASAPAA